jgi:hypothetical protein
VSRDSGAGHRASMHHSRAVVDDQAHELRELDKERPPVRLVPDQVDVHRGLTQRLGRQRELRQRSLRSAFRASAMPPPIRQGSKANANQGGGWPAAQRAVR